MGEFNTVGLEDIIDAFSRREAATVEAVPKMLKAGADVLIEAQRAEAQAMGLNETGGFINSIKATDVKGDDTEKYVEIYPQGRAKHGNDRKGDKSKVRYATIGFVAEYGIIGVPEDMLRQAASMAVCKINIDSDLRLAMTASVREHLYTHPDHFDPRQYLKPGREAIKQMVMHKIQYVLGCENKA